MRKTDELFQLIRSLKQSEKRYFKIYAGRHVIGEENNYVRLFDVLDQQKEYDEDEIRDIFAGEKFIRQLHVVKNYLYRLILRSLRDYYSDKSTDVIVKNLLHEVEILYEKALYAQCLKLLTKARKQADEVEKFLLLLDIINWEKRVIRAGSHAGKLEGKLDEVLKEEQKVLNQLANLAEYQALYSRFHFLIEKEGLPRNEEELSRYSSIINTPLLHDEKKALSFRARVYFHDILAGYYYVKGDAANDYLYTKKLIQLMDGHPGFVSEEINLYIDLIHDFLIASNRHGRFADVDQAIDKLRNLPEQFMQSEDVQVRVFLFSHSQELRKYISMGHFEEGIGRIPSIEKGLERYAEKISRVHEIVFYYQIAYLFFGAGQFRKSLLWLNKILNAADIDLRQDIVSYARMLNMIVHYEIGNFEILDYIVKSTYRYLFPRKKLHRFEQIILEFIRKQSRLKSEDQAAKWLVETRNTVSKIEKSPFENRAFEYFDLLSWLDSKIEKIPFSAIVRKKSTGR